MPIYKVQAPDGRILRLEGPEGASEDQILQAAAAAYQPQPEEGLIRQAADIPVGVAKGAVSGVRNIADIFGAQNVVSQKLRGAEDLLGGLLSAQAKQDQQEIARIMKEAEDKGVGDQLAAAWQAFKTAPLDLAAQGIGSIAPFLVGGAGAKAAELGVAGTRALIGGMGAATGVGVVKSSIYDAVKEEFEKQGFSKETAAEYADKAQSYGENLDQIALGGILGGLSSMTGVESALIPKLAGDISKKLAANKVGRFALTTASEAGTEGAQAAQEQIAQNIALQREGVETPTFRGAAGAAALEGITGGVIGGGVGALTRGQPQAPIETAPEAPPEAQVAPVAPEAAVPAFEPTAVEPALRELELAEAREAGQAVEPIPEMQPGEAIELDPAVKADIESVLQPGMTEEQARPVVQSIVDQTLKDLPVEIRQQAADSVVSDYLQKAQPAKQPTTTAPEVQEVQPTAVPEVAAQTVATPAVQAVIPAAQEPIAAQSVAPKKIVKPEKPKTKKQEVSPNWPSDIPTSLFRGYGREDYGSAYGMTASPIAGKGKYFAFNEDAASMYGPNIESAEAPIKNPYVIRDGNQWSKLTKEAGWEFANPTSLPVEKVEEMTQRLQNILKDRGYDGMIVYWDYLSPYDIGPNQENYRTLNKVFGVPQAVVFEKPTKVVKESKKEKSPAKPSPVRYGFDPVALKETGMYSLVPVDQGGALFKTRREAQQAKKFQANTRLQAVNGGFTLVEQTDPEKRAALISAERLRKAPVAKGPLDILQFLASKGGLSPTLMPEISTDKNIRLGNRTLFAAKGKGLNESIAAEMAAEAGYINDNENLFDVINDSLKVKPRYSINDMDQVAEARYEDYLQAAQASPEVAEPVPVRQQAEALGIDPLAIEEEVARREDLTAEQFEQAVESRLQQEINQRRGQVSDEIDFFDRDSAKTTAAPDWVPEKIWRLHEAARRADDEASGQIPLRPNKEGKVPSVGSLKRNQTMASRRLLKAVEDYVGDNWASQNELMTRMNEESSKRESDRPELDLFEDRNPGYATTGEVRDANDVDALNEDIRDNKIREYQGLKQRLSAIQKRFIEDKSRPIDNELYRSLYRRAEELKSEIDASKPKRSSPEDFMARAAKALADGDMDRETFDVIDAMFKKNPKFLDGLRLSVKAGPEGVSGQFLPIARIVRLFKGTGAINPGTARHEFTHTMEQMMPEDARQKIVDKWLASLKKAVETDTSDQAQKYFKKVSDFLENPTQAKMNEAIAEMPSYEYYQYLTPSEYWAINAEPLMNAYLGSSWQRFKMSMKGMLQAIKKVFGLNNNSEIYTAFKNAINGERRTTEMLVDYINSNLKIFDTKRRDYAGNPAPSPTWDTPPEVLSSKLFGAFSKTKLTYNLQDKYVDLKDIQKAIEKEGKRIEDAANAYQRENLYHKRVADKVSSFLKKEGKPLLEEMQKRKVTLDELNKYLHAKFAEERNNYIAKINPAMSDGGSGITTKDAKDYLAAIPKDKLKDLESVEGKVREIVKGTQQELLKMGWETPETIKAWNATFPNYVPLFREDVDYVNHGTGMGQGMASRGAFSMGATGSAKDVTSILDSIFEMREKAIVKGEKSRVGRALMALAVTNPNPDFWLPIMPDAINDPEQTRRELEALGASGDDIKNLMMEPKVAVVERLKDPVTGQYRNLVVYRVRPNSKFSDNVFPVRINGKDAYIFFNPREERAIRLSKALKNLDVEQLDMLTQQAGKITRFIASMSTQYNPIFGMWNFMRDIQGAGFNLSTTPLKGKQAAVLSDALRIIPDLYKELRAQRRGQEYDSQIAQDYKEFSSLGGPTGYRDQFIKKEESGRIAERMLKELNENNVKATVRAVGGWLSDYNDTLENAIRLAAFRQAKKMGVSPESAASIAKELTVNFNRKGAKTPGLSALYAFFNAAVQGNARLLETLKGPAGKKIIAGGIFLGVAQAMLLQAFGLGEDDPPEFTKQRNLIIPIGDGQYAMWPMPLGFNFLPTLGRLLTETALDPRPEMRKPFAKILEAFTNSFNPLGGGGFMQTISPTIIDPFVAVSQNRDAFGRPISREDRATNPTPGYLRSREQASEFSKTLSEILNYMSFGTEFKKGVISPTADDIDYIAGQYLGGVAREAMRAKEFLQSTVTGEPVEPHRVPLVGKIVGDLGAPAAVANKFYSNITTLAEHEQEIKGRIKNRQSPAEYLREYPEARLFQAANKLENEISRINRTIRQLQAMEGKERQIENLKNRKTEMMKRFNERYDAAVK
jgi:hypothetical protein